MNACLHDGGLDRRIIQNIRFNARRLARVQAVPGMTAEDYEQDLILDLLRRRRAFDRQRASFATFADRVVSHRINSLRTPTHRLRRERNLVSLDTFIEDDEGNAVTRLDLLRDDAAPIDDCVAMQIDVRRFVETLTAPLLAGCKIMLSDSVSHGAAVLGVHRSTAHVWIRELRNHAHATGLDAYRMEASDRYPVAPVCDGEQTRGFIAPSLETEPMLHRTTPPRVHLVAGEDEFRDWLAQAKRGDAFEYHRGVLAIDRLPQGSRLGDADRRELNAVARLAFSLHESGRAHVLQRRYGDGDYGYLIVVRPSAMPDKGCTSEAEHAR